MLVEQDREMRESCPGYEDVIDISKATFPW